MLLTSRMILTFQGHNYIKSHFGPYLGSCWINCHQILTLSSLGGAFQQIKKYPEGFERETYANALR